MNMVVARRVPPGDRWNLTGEEGDVVIYETLTDCLNQIYKVHSSAQFYIDAREGTISIDDGVPTVEPIKKFDLYGEK
jgi:hypothetical protein